MAGAARDILLAFLRSPLDRRRFHAFLELTLRKTVSRLRALRARGYRLPADDRTDSDPLIDLAISVWDEPSLLKKDRRIFTDLIKLVHREGYSPFDDTHSDRIEALYSVYLTIQIRQRLRRIRVEHDAEPENLKRRFSDILQELSFIERTDLVPGIVLVGPPSSEVISPDNLNLIPPPVFQHFVEEAFLHSTTRSTWCREIFRILNETTSYSPLVPRHDLLAAVVKVNARFLQGNEFGPSSLPNPEEALLQKRLKKALDRAVETVHATTICRFVSQGRLTAEEGRCLKNALGHYLEDLAFSPEADSLPQYFRDHMAAETHARYLKDYKFIFDTIVADGRKRLRENSIGGSTP